MLPLPLFREVILGKSSSSLKFFIWKMRVRVSTPPIQRQHWDDGCECQEAQVRDRVPIVHLWIWQWKQDASQVWMRLPFLLVCEEYWKDMFSFIFCIYILYLFTCSLIITTTIIPTSVVAWHCGIWRFDVWLFPSEYMISWGALKAPFSSSPSPRPTVNVERQFVLNDRAEWYLFPIPRTAVKFKV